VGDSRPVEPKRSGRVCVVFSEPADHELRVRASGILDRSHKVNQAVRAFPGWLSVGPVDCQAVDEHHAKIRIFRRALRCHVERPPCRQQRRQRSVLDVKIQLEPSLGAVLDHRLSICVRHKPDHRDHSEQSPNDPPTTSWHLAS
jgi:hypothetical protein